MIRKCRGMIDMTMFILFIVMMGYHMFGEVIHEWLGIVLFLVCILHQSINRRWFMAISKGKYIYERKLFLGLNLLLLISFIITISSGMLLSKHLFTYLDAGNLTVVRKLHMTGSVWTFLWMSMHAGLHLRLRQYKNSRKYLIAMAGVCFFLYGCFAFHQRGFLLDMVAWNDFKFLPYGESFLTYVIDYMAIAWSGAAIGYVLLHKKDIYKHRIGKCMNEYLKKRKERMQL